MKKLAVPEQSENENRETLKLVRQIEKDLDKLIKGYESKFDVNQLTLYAEDEEDREGLSNLIQSLYTVKMQAVNWDRRKPLRLTAV